MFSGKEMPKLPKEEEKFNRKVSFFEATTESISQFTLSSVIFRIFGISDSPTTKFFQYFSIATSSLSLTIAFISVRQLSTGNKFYHHKCNLTLSLQRQLDIRPMKTPPFDKSFNGAIVWFLWKISFVVYILISALPMVCYIACLFVIAIKREASILICMAMMAMLHPVITLVTGVFTKTIGRFLSKKFPIIFKYDILARLFTYSINGHFMIIACMTLYLYEMWISFGKAAGFEFSNKSYDQCTCDFLEEKGFECENRETNNSFQNLFIRVPVRNLLLVFFTISIICHLIQSVFKCLPAPVQLLYFILGKEYSQTERKTVEGDTGSQIEVENLHKKLDTEKIKTSRSKEFKIGIKVMCCLIAIVVFTGLLSSPLFGSKLFPNSSNGKNKIIWNDFCIDR